MVLLTFSARLVPRHHEPDTKNRLSSVNLMMELELLVVTHVEGVDGEHQGAQDTDLGDAYVEGVCIAIHLNYLLVRQ